MFCNTKKLGRGKASLFFFALAVRFHFLGVCSIVVGISSFVKNSVLKRVDDDQIEHMDSFHSLFCFSLQDNKLLHQIYHTVCYGYHSDSTIFGEFLIIPSLRDHNFEVVF